jgi:hypothetical protein
VRPRSQTRAPPAIHGSRHAIHTPATDEYHCVGDVITGQDRLLPGCRSGSVRGMIQRASSFADSCDTARIARLQEVCRQYVLETRCTPHGNSQNLDLHGRRLEYPSISVRLAGVLEVSWPLFGGRAMIAQVPLLRNAHKDWACTSVRMVRCVRLSKSLVWSHDLWGASRARPLQRQLWHCWSCPGSSITCTCHWLSGPQVPSTLGH